MHHLIGTITVGMLAGLASREGVRSSVRGLVKGGIVATRKLQKFGAASVGEVRRIVDEARADLDQQEPEPEVTRPRRGVKRVARERRG